MRPDFCLILNSFLPAVSRKEEEEDGGRKLRLEQEKVNIDVWRLKSKGEKERERMRRPSSLTRVFHLDSSYGSVSGIKVCP